MENENILLNPIDIIEDVIHQKKWNFSRAADHELSLIHISEPTRRS